MTFEAWWIKEHGYPLKISAIDFARSAWYAAIAHGLEEAAERFEGTLAFNWVAADGYANGADVGSELRYMAQERSNVKLSGSTASSSSPVPTPG